MEALLKKHFGYDKFRPLQLEIINSVLNKKDVLVLMPTGGGKSICYQVPALKLKGLTIVISPLISLMKDQVDALQLNGIKAQYINSTLSKEEIKEIELRIKNKEIKLLYIAPERLALKAFKDFIKEIDISLIAIDEAHCISEWGHDFRKEYSNLKHLKATFPNIPIIALTATATSEVKKDILKQLKLEDPKIFTSSFNRENLNLILREKNNTFAQILSLVEKNKGESTIIYCHSRKDTQTLSDGLNKYGFKSLPYHAGLSIKAREKAQESFITDKVNVIVATIAFGMGIDKSNVRLIIHNTFSKSIEGYYQEIGRAGRDGLESNCVLFYCEADKRKHEYFINIIGNKTQRITSNKKLDTIIKYCEGETCRRKYLLEYFGEEYTKENCNSCDICLNLPRKSKDASKVLSKSNKTYSKELFEELKTLRKDIANQNNITPTNIFTDTSLREMATLFPNTEKDFLKISGVVKQKLKDFGEEFLMLINEHIVINGIVNNIKKDDLEYEVKKPKTKYKKKRYTKARKWKKKS